MNSLSLATETVWSISGVGVRALRGVFHSTRGPERMCQLCTSSHSNGKRWVAMHRDDKSWQHLSLKLTSRWVLSIGRGKITRFIGVRYTVSNGLSWDVLKTNWFWSKSKSWIYKIRRRRLRRQNKKGEKSTIFL